LLLSEKRGKQSANVDDKDRNEPINTSNYQDSSPSEFVKARVFLQPTAFFNGLLKYLGFSLGLKKEELTWGGKIQAIRKWIRDGAYLEDAGSWLNAVIATAR
jgi:hypothetical protein